MKIVLIQGDENTGKTTLCNQIDEWLQKEFVNESWLKNFKNNRRVMGKMEVIKDVSHAPDFFAIYNIELPKNKLKRIIINSLSDDEVVIEKFKDFFTKHKEYDSDKDKKGYDLLITAIRPFKTVLCDKMKEILGQELLDELEKDTLSLKQVQSYSVKEDSKENLLIKLEKTPLQVIKDKIKSIF
jgi:hypothetical protein